MLLSFKVLYAIKYMFEKEIQTRSKFFLETKIFVKRKYSFNKKIEKNIQAS